MEQQEAAIKNVSRTVEELKELVVVLDNIVAISLYKKYNY